MGRTLIWRGFCGCVFFSLPPSPFHESEANGPSLPSSLANSIPPQTTRRLAKEQFVLRATINKILLGLAVRRERVQSARSNGGGGGGGGGPATT